MFFSPRGKPVTMDPWLPRVNCAICTGSLGLNLWPVSMGFLAIRRRWFSPSSGAEKNGLRGLWAGLVGLLRPKATPSSRPFLWRQARLSRFLYSAGALSVVRGREDREFGLACRQSVLHQTVCLLRRTTLPRQLGQSRGRRIGFGLADGQGVGQAIHGRAIAAGRPTHPQGDRH